MGARCLDEEHDGDNIPTAWHWKGYDGMKCGPVIYAERADSSFFQVSGSAASRYWLEAERCASNISRLDAQVTLCDVPPTVDLARRSWEAMERDPERSDAAGWRSWITTRPTGSTLYVGSPKSDRRFRLYDKAAESPAQYPTGAWRYELQARGGLARSIATGLAGGDGNTDAILHTVHQCFSARGVTPRFRPGSGGVLGSDPRSRSDAERRLEWLRKQVRPTIDWLAERGRDADAARALGLA